MAWKYLWCKKKYFQEKQGQLWLYKINMDNKWETWKKFQETLETDHLCKKMHNQRTKTTVYNNRHPYYVGVFKPWASTTW